MTDDLDAIRRVLGGDIESFRLLVERYAGPVLRMIGNITGDNRACEDLAQDVFLAAFAQLRTFNSSRSRFSTWLFTIARNTSVNAARRKKPVYLAEPPERIDARSPAEAAARREVFAALDRALLTLPVHQRTAFVLAEIEGLPYETVAQIEGARIGTIKSRINRARARLKETLNHFEGDVP
jgi:RNA polymerase sigma-70 factor (ECF subfamily)